MNGLRFLRVWVMNFGVKLINGGGLRNEIIELNRLGFITLRIKFYLDYYHV
jgi:hypothetical protein